MKNKISEYFGDKVILVTGGTGSIGSEIVRKLANYPVKQLRVLSRGEYKQFMLERAFKDQPKGRISFLIGDVRDRDRVFLAAEGVDMIFNAAAMKHVHLCEFNPFEAIKTNVYGTQNLVDAARAYNVEKFVHVSTDKAAMPVNVMGATKLLAEKIVISAEQYKGKHKTVFCAVRFGNVFASRGSVVPLFIEQIKKGGPVTLTHKDMTRFMMSIPQAAELMLKSAYYSKGGELFILKMPVMRIEDMARGMIEIFAPKYGHDPKKIKIEITGKREGEKIYELLLTDGEAEDIYENEDMFCITKTPGNGFKTSNLNHYRSDEGQIMAYPEVVTFLKQELEGKNV
jgi:FlaA1/EpsC-like NDP-sugar epimerase